MSNWFEQNPLKSIISHTIVVGGAIAALSYFLLVDYYKVQLDNKDSEIKGYKARIESLEYENNKYLEWLKSTPKTIPYFEVMIKKLEEKNKVKEVQLTKILESEKQSNETPTENNKEIIKIASKKYLSTSKPLKKGETFVDEYTNVILGVNDISSDYKTNINLTLPNEITQELENIPAGENWSFSFENKNFKLIVNRVNWVSGIVEVEVKEF